MAKTITEFYGVSPESALIPRKALLWQHNAAENLQKLIEDKEIFFTENSTMFWCSYLFTYFYLGETTEEDGITIWSIILDYGVSATSDANVDDVWGFGDDDEQFDQAGFGNQNDSVVNLPLEYAILALQMRYFRLTTNCSVPQINAFLNRVTGWDGSNETDPKIIVVDNYDMTITYRFNYTPDQFMRFILDDLDLLPRPAGVGVNWEVQFEDIFGFTDDDEQFDQGVFGA